MFFPLHDRNNPKVNRTPYLTYLFGVLFLVGFAFQTTLMFSNAPPVSRDDEEGSALRLLVARHGLVPSAFLQGNPEYSCSFAGDEITIRSRAWAVWAMPLTYLFLHGGLLHLIGNLWFFWIFSDDVEDRLGPLGFFLLFFAAGIIGGLTHVLVHPDSTNPLIGSSGAVAGIMGAYVVLFPRHRVTTYFCPIWFYIRRFDVSAWVVLGFFFFFQSLSLWRADLTTSQVAFDCHLGGFLGGFLVAWLVRILRGEESSDPAGTPMDSTSPTVDAVGTSAPG